MKHTRTIWIAGLAVITLTGCFGKKQPAPAAGTTAEPDTVLYSRATNDIKHSHYTTARLDLQTLINTYPDSEFLAKAKLAIADSYYKEGGSAGLKQAIIEYKDFITFFPFLDEASYAQMQVGMSHFRQMEKPDRDRSEAEDAEAEFQTFLQKYPNNPLAPQAEQRLRETQEVLAEGNFRIARFYYLRQANRAAGARLLELTSRYPLYSQADQANWMLAQIYEKGERNDYAARYYGNIVRNYPKSPLVPDAKSKLVKFGVPVPQPDPDAMVRMEAEAKIPHLRSGMVGRSLGMMKRGPDVSTAAKVGTPTMTPAGDETGTINLVPSATPTAAVGVPANSATVETVTPGSAPSPAAASSEPPASNPAAGPADTSSAPASATGAAPAAATSDSSAASSSSSSSSAQGSSSSSTSQASPADKTQESTSKKKKGIHKIIPF